VDAVILQKIVDYSTGVGIEITSLNLTGCACFANAITCCGTCTDLNCILQAYADCLCSMYTDLQIIKVKVNQMFDGPYDVMCLDANSSGKVTNSSKLPAILQELITEFCALYGQVQAIQTIINNLGSTINTTVGNFLLSAIFTCQGNQTIIKSGTGATASLEFRGFTPIGGIIPYAGPTAGKFDPSGLGLANTDMCGWALANGNNGTINMQGQMPQGSMQMGGTFPTNTGGITTLPVGDTAGEAAVTLIGSQIPSLPLTATTNSTTATATVGFQYGFKSSVSGNNGICYPSNINNQPAVNVLLTVPSLTVTGYAAGGGGAHNNIPPCTILYYIQRVS